MMNKTKQKPTEGRIYERAFVMPDGEKRTRKYYVCRPDDYGYSSSHITLAWYIPLKVVSEGEFKIAEGWAVQLWQFPSDSVSVNKNSISYMSNPTTDPNVREEIIDECSSAMKRIEGRNLISTIRKAEQIAGASR